MLSSAISVQTKDNYDTSVMQIKAVMIKNRTWNYLNDKMKKAKIKRGAVDEIKQMGRKKMLKQSQRIRL